jgi:hypothetical protein
MTEQAAEQALAEADQHGAPYGVPRSGVSYEQAVAIARSAHPSRVLANTMGYRYGRFTEQPDGSVDVEMMGSHIATFTPEGVQLWARGWATASTSEALSNLVTGGWFYTEAGETRFRSYADTPDRTVHPFTEGGTYHYADNRSCPHCGCGGQP